jgi:large subunit ribosomal protein L35
MCLVGRQVCFSNTEPKRCLAHLLTGLPTAIMLDFPWTQASGIEDDMSYKLKPNKSMMSRFKVSKTGKVKRHHAYRSHLLSGRNPAQKRRLRRPGILCETLAGNMRRFMCVSHLNPKKVAHERRVAAAAAAKAEKSGEQPQA